MDAIGYALATSLLTSVEVPASSAPIANPPASLRSSGQGAYGEINNIIYIWYGQRIESYDPVAGTWTNKTTGASNLGNISTFGVINNRLIVAHDSAGSTYNNRWGYYNPSNNTWALTDDSGSGTTRDNYTLGAVTNLGLHAVGGRVGGGIFQDVHKVLSDHGGVWTTKAVSPISLGGNGSAAGQGNTLYIINPYDPSFVATRDIFVYDVVSNTWSTETDVIESNLTTQIQAWMGSDGSLFYAIPSDKNIVYQRSPGESTFKAFTYPFGTIYYSFGTPNFGIAVNSSGTLARKFTSFKKLKNHPILGYLASK